MKAVMISIQPKWCELIASGRKTIEVRKTRPKIDTPFKCYIYCTQGKYKDLFAYSERIYQNRGKVIGEFVCGVSEYFYDKLYEELFDESIGCFIDLFVYDLTYEELEQTCLSYEELEKYGNTNTLYGWHISDLVIYDKPRELGEFKLPCKNDNDCDNCDKARHYCINTINRDFVLHSCELEEGLTRPPQSWCYVEEKENENE